MTDHSPQNQSSDGTSRRAFLKKSTTLLAGGALAAGVAKPPMIYAAGGETLKVGLIGCGGRGNGAAVNAVRADPNVKMTALADIFPDQVEKSLANLKQRLGDKVAVDDDHCFTGVDAYKELMQTDVDVVLLCSPPHFRPAQLKAAVDAGKHIFCEKPVAVDAPGVRHVLATAEEAKRKGLSLVSGLCFRYHHGMRETIKRIKEGAIGDIVAIQENYLTSTLWHRGRSPNWSEMEYQIRNWLYFTWLSGDHNVEQHIHSLDKALWLMDDQPPVSCFGLGGRQVRTDEQWGHIYDHHAVCYEFAGGIKVFSYTRQMDRCDNDVDDYVLGTQGSARLLKFSIEGPRPWRYDGPKPSMYDVEHQELFAGIRSGKHINNGLYMSRSTLLAIMGRMATYTGRTITWDEAINSTQDLTPAKYEWGDVQTPEVAMPGLTNFS